MIIFWIVWMIWFTSEILLNRFMRSGPEDKKNQDRGSVRLIWMIIALANTSGILFTVYTEIPISGHYFLPYIGLIVIAIGMILRFASIRTLGRFFTVDVTIRDNHALKKGGLYKIVRHPSYSGSLLSFIGFGISLNNWLSLITITILITIAFLYRIRIEEKALINQFGSDYLDYKNKTYCLIPWIY